MDVRGVSHIAVGVSDMERALFFYRDCLGLRVAADWRQAFAADQGAELHGGRSIDRRIVWMRWSDSEEGASLALDQLTTPQPADRRADIYDLGIHHFAFWVEDIDPVIERARSMGFRVIMPHVANAKDYGETSGDKIRSVFLRDPDGNLVQCDQRVKATSN